MLLINAIIAEMTSPPETVDIRRNAVAMSGNRIVWVGDLSAVPEPYRKLEVLDLEGRLVTPGLIDCHTHIVYSGNRANEFEMRLEGASYAEIAAAGGGIISTVTETRQCSEQQLLHESLPRVDALIAEGVTTIEIKSGYGLDINTELKMLRVARMIADVRPLRVRTSFLGAHTVPAEYSGRADAYIDELCIPALDAAHEEHLIDAVDGFCETIAFSAAQIRRLFDHATGLGLRVKLHAGQLSNLGGAALAAEYRALSAEHLEFADEAEVKALAEAGTVAVLLPGAFYNLRETRLPPIDLFRRHNVSMAVATDCNPGSSPLTSALLAMNMACTLFKLTPNEALLGMTRHAAQALALPDCGVIAPGMVADLAVWDAESPSELCYRIGFNPLSKRIFGGKICD